MSRKARQGDLQHDLAGALRSAMSVLSLFEAL
jgi:hypothetical protein